MDCLNLRSVEELLDKERRRIEGDAKDLVELFWSHREEMLEVRSGGLTPTLGCRLIKRERSVSISWFYWRFYKIKGTTKRTNVHITKPKNKNKYSMRKLLSRALPNEMDAVEHCESGFAVLRKQSEALRKLNQALYYFKESCGCSSVINETKSPVSNKFGEKSE